MSRYVVTEKSESGHCCFSATVVDTKRPHPVQKNKPDWICECFEIEDAHRIAAALNEGYEGYVE